MVSHHVGQHEEMVIRSLAKFEYKVIIRVLEDVMHMHAHFIDGDDPVAPGLFNALFGVFLDHLQARYHRYLT